MNAGASIGKKGASSLGTSLSAALLAALPKKSFIALPIPKAIYSPDSAPIGGISSMLTLISTALVVDHSCPHCGQVPIACSSESTS
jgi:hypothetical protein